MRENKLTIGRDPASWTGRRRLPCLVSVRCLNRRLAAKRPLGLTDFVKSSAVDSAEIVS